MRQFLRGERGPSLLTLWLGFTGFVLTALLIVFALVFISTHNLNNRVKVESNRNATALCALRSSLNQSLSERRHQIDKTADFLNTHRGPKILGLPRKLFTDGLAEDRASLAGQNRSYRALRFIHCPPDTPPTKEQLK